MRDVYKGIHKRIGWAVRSERKKREIPGSTVADRIGKTTDYLYRLERGSSWSLWAFLTVCDAIGMGSRESLVFLGRIMSSQREDGQNYPPLPPA